VAAIQRAAPSVATRAGSPPRGITREDLAPYEVVLVGQPESIDGVGFDALRWFVEERGGVAVFVPDRAPDARPASLAGGVAFDAKTLEAPVTLGGIGAGLMSAELARPRALPPLAFPLAVDPEGAPVVFGLRRGLGAVIVSGALDAWRYRDRNGGAFARFWRAAILQQAQTVPPVLEVTAVPSLARPADLVRVSVRLRETALSVGDRISVPEAAARVVKADRHGEAIVRLWPASAPGVYEGEWRPATTGDYAVDATIGGANGAALVKVASDVVMPASDPAAAEIAARATGGGVLEHESGLMRALSDRFPSRTVTRPSHPARSPWYAAVFALLLCGEWAIRRRRGFA
jgi:hypothetical protein